MKTRVVWLSIQENSGQKFWEHSFIQESKIGAEQIGDYPTITRVSVRRYSL